MKSIRRAKIAAKVVITFGTIFSCNAQTTTTYDFLRDDVSARAAAMAGSFVSMRNDVNSIFYNPAGLATVEQPQASFGYFKHLLDINSGYASFTQGFQDGNIGVGVDYINYGQFTQTDELANTLGTFNAGEMAVSLGYAHNLEDNFSYGAAAKFIYSSIAGYSSTAVAADLGLLYYIPGTNPVSLGVSILNMGTQLNPYINTREDLPLDVRIGATIKPQHLPLLLNINIHNLNQQEDTFADRFQSFSIGGEFTLSKPLRFRFGYDNQERQDWKIGTSAGMAGFSLGGGIVLETVQFDYAYTSLGKIGSFNRVTVGVNL
jgi:hypothetical protein